MNVIHTPVQKIIVVTNPTTTPAKSNIKLHPYTVFNIYAQVTSLQKLLFFGLGPTTPESGKSIFGKRETIVGGNAIVPVTNVPVIRNWSVSLLGEMNGRFVDVRGNDGQPRPSIEQL